MSRNPSPRRRPRAGGARTAVPVAAAALLLTTAAATAFQGGDPPPPPAPFPAGAVELNADGPAGNSSHRFDSDVQFHGFLHINESSPVWGVIGQIPNAPPVTGSLVQFETTQLGPPPHASTPPQPVAKATKEFPSTLHMRMGGRAAYVAVPVTLFVPLLAGCAGCEGPPSLPAPPPEVLAGGDVGGRERGLGMDQNLFSSVGGPPWGLADYLSVEVGENDYLWGAVPVRPGKQETVDVTVTFRAAGNPAAGFGDVGCPKGTLILSLYPSDGESPPGRLPFEIDGVLYQPKLQMVDAEPAGDGRLRATVAVPVTDPFPPHGYVIFASVECAVGTYATPLFTLVDATADAP